MVGCSGWAARPARPGGRRVRAGSRRRASSTPAQVSASTPGTTSGRWFRRRSPPRPTGCRPRRRGRPGAEDDPVHAGEDGGAGAHGAGLERDHERAARSAATRRGRRRSARSASTSAWAVGRRPPSRRLWPGRRRRRRRRARRRPPARHRPAARAASASARASRFPHGGQSRGPLRCGSCGPTSSTTPLVAHKLTTLRDVRTESPILPAPRRRAGDAAWPTRPRATCGGADRADHHPVSPTTGVRLAEKPLVVPILRAGLGMLDGMVRLLPTARGRLPRDGPQRGDPRGRDVRRAAARRPVGAPVLTCSNPCSPPGHPRRAIRFLVGPRRRPHHRDLPARAHPRAASGSSATSRGVDVPVTVVTAAMDERLIEVGYIVPGLGDAATACTAWPSRPRGAPAQSALTPASTSGERLARVAEEQHRAGLVQQLVLDAAKPGRIDA